MAIQWDETQRDNVTVATLAGEFDLRASRDLESTFQQHVEARTPALLLDFAEVAFIDSSGIASLITYYRDAKEFGGKLGLANVRAPIQNVFNLVSLGTFFPIYDDVESGIAAMKAG
jgi:anti-anti-sigma factor